MNDENENEKAIVGVAIVFGALFAGFLIAAIVSAPFTTSNKLLLLAIVVAGIGVGLAGLVRKVG